MHSRTTHRWIAGMLLLLIVMLAGLASADAQASGDNTQRAQVTAQINAMLRDLTLDSKAKPQDIEQLTELKLKILSPATSLTDRQAAYKEALLVGARLLGVPPLPEAVLTAVSQSVGQNAHQVLNDCESRPVSQTPTPAGQAGGVEKRGRGAVPMILLPDVFTDWTLYRAFMQRNEARYTMYAVTLPGHGGTPPPQTPAYEPAATPLWDNAEQIVLNLIAKEKLNKPIIVGTQAGAYLAARLAIRHPDKVRGAVLLNGLVNVLLRSPADPTRLATMAERRQAVNTRNILQLLLTAMSPHVLPSRACAEKLSKALPPQQRAGIFVNTRNQEEGIGLYINGTMGTDFRAFRYTFELANTDLTEEFKELRVPVLSIVSVADDNSPGQGSPGPAQWREMELRYPTIPLTVSNFDNTRAYALLEAPDDLDRALAAFVAGKPVTISRPPLHAARPSPRATVSQAIGATVVTVAYGRPQVKERKVWGGQVPYNRVWRAGANEATKISFSTDVLIEGQKLAAGEYAFFVIPTDGEWTIIFNKVADQWGAFAYNPEFDALRVKVTPQWVEHQEWLGYEFENLSQTAAQLVLRGEKLKLACKIELPPAVAAAAQK